MKTKHNSRFKSVVSLLIVCMMIIGMVPTTFAAQDNEYVDPADSWVVANGRTNELDMNATTTYETQYCAECDKTTTVLTYRVPEYTRSGETALNRGVMFSDGTLIDGEGRGNLDDGTPGVDSYYTGYRRERANDEMHNIIEAYINAVKNKRYEEDNTDLCNAFKAVGGLPFVKIGYLAMREEFIGMFKYYAELFVAKWIGSNKCIHSKNVGVQYVFKEMLCHEDFEIKYDFMYILDDNVVDSTLFVNIVDDIFIKKWTVIVRDSIAQDESLRQITKRIGFAKLYRIAEKMQEEVEKYFRRIAARYTKRREIITMRKIQLFLFGRILEYGEYDMFIEKYNICGEDGCLWHFTTRQFRKTIAVTLIENGASVDEVGYWLGHLGRSNTMKYYAEVRKAKLAEMNSKFFKDKFDLIISQEQLTQYSEEERKLLYVDFCMEYRRVELGYCLQKIADGGCNKRNSLYNCVNCTNLCTGKKYLSYWKELLEQQNLTVQKLFDSYEKQNITDYTEYKEYKQETFLQQCYLNIVNAIENAEVQDE